MAPQNSTLINLINDDVKSIASERLSPIEKEAEISSSDDEVGKAAKPTVRECLMNESRLNRAFPYLSFRMKTRKFQYTSGRPRAMSPE